MDVQVYSDVVCPWCYIGKRRFAKGLAQVPEATVRLRWLPFQLDPTAPAEPTPVVDAYAAKFGGVERARQMIDQVTEVAAAEGLTFNLDRALRANTFDAHRLLQWADGMDEGAQERLAERLFAGYFTEGRNIADRATLCELAGAADLDSTGAQAVLDSDEYGDEVRRLLREGGAMGINSVPTFLFEGPDSEVPFALPGAQDPTTFARFIRKLNLTA
jgi:predicted DsbA family dithiol-disulfide isomerase